MTTGIQLINIGTYANDGTGDDIRTAFTKVNANFVSLNAAIGVTAGVNLDSGVGIYKDVANGNLEFKTLTSTDNSVTITSTPTTVNLAATANLVGDPAPQLGGNLDINGHLIFDRAGGGDVQATVFGISVPIVQGLLNVLFLSNRLNIDMSPNLSFVPTGSSDITYDHRGTNIDLGYFLNPFTSNPIDFGTFY